MIFCCEDLCFFGAIWLFVINYYETAIDFEHILLSEESYLRTQDSFKKTLARKKHFNWIRWSVFVLICVLSVLQGTSIFFKNSIQEVLGIVSYNLLSAVNIGT